MTEVTKTETTTEANERELLAVARMLRRGKGSFVLAFARLNIPAQRERLVSALRDVLAPLDIKITEITLSEPETDIYEALTSAPGNGNPLFIYGLENVMPSDKPERALSQLNERRGRYQELIRPLVFWVPEHVLRLVAEHAPDFWAWRSGVYAFMVDKGLLSQTYEREIAKPFHKVINLNFAEKQERIRLLRALLDDYGDNDHHTKAARSNVLHGLGQLYEQIGQYEIAEQMYDESRELEKQLENRLDVAKLDFDLATLYKVRGDLVRAKRLLLRSLKVFKEYDDKGSTALAQSQLGDIYYSQRKLQQAERLYAQSLETQRGLADQHDIASAMRSLADIHLARGNYDTAESLVRESLKIDEDLGDHHCAAVATYDLAHVYRVRGDYEQAVALFQRAAQTFESLGEPREVAMNLYYLAISRIEQEKFTEALEPLIKSRDLFRQIGMDKDANENEQIIQHLTEYHVP